MINQQNVKKVIGQHLGQITATVKAQHPEASPEEIDYMVSTIISNVHSSLDLAGISSKRQNGTVAQPDDLRSTLAIALAHEAVESVSKCDAT